MTEILLQILEIVGTVAFAVSGAFVSIKSGLDLFGILFVGCISAVGGGIMRDCLIGRTPPAIFSNVHILLIAALSALGVFLFAYFYRKKFDNWKERVEQVNNVFDAFGLAAFAVMGTEIGFVYGLSANGVLTVTLGLLTAVGGGVLRDVLTASTPYIFKKHVYAIAALVGGILYYVIRLFGADTLLPTLLSMAVIVGIRLLATKYRWSLPKIKETVQTERAGNSGEKETAQTECAGNSGEKETARIECAGNSGEKQTAQTECAGNSGEKDENTEVA